MLRALRLRGEVPEHVLQGLVMRETSRATAHSVAGLASSNHLNLSAVIPTFSPSDARRGYKSFEPTASWQFLVISYTLIC